MSVVSSRGSVFFENALRFRKIIVGILVIFLVGVGAILAIFSGPVGLFLILFGLFILFIFLPILLSSEEISIHVSWEQTFAFTLILAILIGGMSYCVTWWMWRQIPKTETTVLSIQNKPELVVLDVETRKPFVDSSGHYVRYVPTVYDYAYHLFAWAPLSVFVLTILYLLIESFSFSDESRKVKIGWCGILLLLNSRTKIFLNEGDHPLLPWKWLFSVASVNLQKRELVADSEPIYTADHAQAEYTLTLYLRVTEPFAYLDKSNPEGSIQTTALSVLREHVQRLKGDQADVIQNNNELKQEICRTINESQWGVTVFEVAITNVRIEEEYHKALLAIAVERNQAESERIQMGNVRERIKELIEESKCLYPDDPGKWLSFAQAADIVAIQQGDKVQGNTVKTFNIHADESASAGAGLLFGLVDSITEALGANRGGQNQQGGRRNRRRDANRGGQNQQGGN